MNLAQSLTSESQISPLLTGTGKKNTHLIIVSTSDRGLCGPFNSSIVKVTKTFIADLRQEGKEVKIICVGKRGYEQLISIYGSENIERFDGSVKKDISYSDADNLAKQIIEKFNNGEFDICTIIYNHFVSAMCQKVTTKQLIPAQLEVEIDDKIKGLKDKENSLYEYEPDEDTILAELLPKNISVQIYYMLLENAASEHGARMTAMDSATNSASKMMKDLTLQYNRTRQAVITKELIEIISGAEAV